MARKGQPLSDEYKAKISASLMGHAVSDELRAKLSAAHMGKRQSRETRAKISAAQTGSKHAAGTHAGVRADTTIRTPPSKRLSRYGLTPSEYENMFVRQRGRCLGCQKSLIRIHVDHDHVTGKVRGLLCPRCNAALGFAMEDPATLRRLVAYLTSYDRARTYIYVAGALQNSRVPEVASALREHGYEAWDEWHGAGPHADDHWRDYEVARGHTYAEALGGIGAQNTFLFDLAHLDLADYLVLVMPAGRSSHLELGYFLGKDKPAFILLDSEPERFEVMPNFATAVCSSVSELLGMIEREETGEGR